MAAASGWVRPALGSWTWHRQAGGPRLGGRPESLLFSSPSSPCRPWLPLRLSGWSPSLRWMELPAGDWAEERPLCPAQPDAPRSQWHGWGCCRGLSSLSGAASVSPGFLQSSPPLKDWTFDSPAAVVGRGWGSICYQTAGVLEPVEFCVHEPSWGWRRAT